jgi:ATP-binding cassette subfamily F protein 3
MIRIQQLTLIRGTKPLIESADLTLNPGEKIGLIGANGSGKSSLFALLRNELHPDAGDADFPAAWRVAHVAQETPALDRTALDYAIDGDTTLRRLEAELAEAETAHDGHRIGELHAALQDADSYTVRARAEQLLTGLGFSNDQMRLPIASFSGGWRMRLNLAQALMCPSDLLLLDEPTNHLDLDAILWLEDWLKRYPGTLIVISHDRDFLDGVVNVVVHIDGRKLKRYGGNYSSFEKQRAINLSLGQAQFEKQSRERAHLQSFIDRFKAKASKAKQAQSRMKMLAKMEELAPIHAAASFSFEFGEPERAPNPLLVLEDIVAGKGLAIGYFAQHQLEMLRHDQSPLWHLAKLSPTTREQELRNFLGGFNFNGEMATAAIAPLSGGEKARLALALIVWQRPNLLLLDEPTNHLDLETREALTVALAQFEGTLILVSHDRHLLRATTDEFMIVADGALKPFDGDLDDYRDWLFKTKLGQSKSAKPAKAEQPAKPEVQAAPTTQADRKEQKRQEAEARQRLAGQRKPIENRIRRLEELLDRHHARQAEIETRLADPDIYADTRKDELKQLLFEQANLVRDLGQIEAEWMEQQEALEALEA